MTPHTTIRTRPISLQFVGRVPRPAADAHVGLYVSGKDPIQADKPVRGLDAGVGTRPTGRPTSVWLAAVLSTLLLAGCSGKYGRTAVQNDEGEPAAKTSVVSSLRMSDAAAKDQLTKGFYGLESGAWRWTAGKFSVLLKTPPGAAQKGATVTLALDVSDVILKQVHSQSLTASIGNTTLKSENYTDPGNHTFSAVVPAASLTSDTVTIDFSLDHPLPPGPADLRELGVIVTAVALETS